MKPDDMTFPYYPPMRSTLSSLFLVPQGFNMILSGKMDHLPEVAFYMVGNIEEAEAKAVEMAKKGWKDKKSSLF